MASIEIKFDKGLNSKIDYLTDAPGHCLTFTDMQLDYGILRPRTTMNVVNQSVINSGATTIDGVYYWCDTSQAGIAPAGNIYISAASKCFRSSVYAPSSDGAVTTTDITNSVTQNTGPISYASLNGILVYTGTSGNVIKITSHSANCASLSGSVSANFTILRTVNNMMFGSTAQAGASSSNSTFYWSAYSDPTTWPAGSTLTFRNNDGDAICGFGELNGNLLIFKQNSIGLLNTSTTIVSGTVTLGPLTTLFQGVGAVCNNAIDNLPDGRCVFLGSDFNVYITDGSTLISLTNNGVGGLNLIDALSANAPFVLANTNLKYFPLRNEIVLSCVGALSSTPFTYAYDLSQNYWRQITGITPYSMCVVRNANNSSTSPKATSAILIGNNKGNIIDLARDNNLAPTTETGASPTTVSTSASVVIPENFFNSNLLFVTIIYTATGSGAQYACGFDGTYGSFTTLSTSNKRLCAKVPIPGSSSAVRPSSFQIEFTNGGGGATYSGLSVYKVILSDEATN